MREGTPVPFARRGPQEGGAPGGPEELRRRPCGRVRLALNKSPGARAGAFGRSIVRAPSGAFARGQH